jgi:enoyl-CoA hydratase/carnithine racemase
VQISAAVAMPDEYAGEVPALFVVARPGAAIDLPGLRRHLEANVHEPPARPRSVRVLDALPVTAVGKIFKPALRDLAIEEKVRIELARACGPDATAKVEVRLDARKRTLVDVAVAGASASGLEALALALRPLPQGFSIAAAAAEAATDAVSLALDDGIAVLTLNRPGKLNALSREVMHALDARLDALAATSGVRVVLLAASGRAFSAGGDLVEFDEALHADPARLLADLRFNQGVMSRLEALPMPLIGVANGLAVAGGLELLLCCDLILAAEGARLGDGHARYGVVPAGGATVRLRERITPSRAAELFYTAGLVDAATLHAWGLVNEVVPPTG